MTRLAASNWWYRRMSEGEDVRTTTRSITSRQGPSERAPAPSLTRLAASNWCYRQ